ncbi:MAG: D-aminoacyl-tRNA deacylase [Gammaproteobacteria bacterium]|nr:D-aminoacyl-tRNA deacylase [Gammaproteobacteria bacterium]
MRALLQRVSEASVSVADQEIAAIGLGLLVFIAVYPNDGDAELNWMVDKTLGLRIFPDSDKSMNASVVDVSGELLVVSQFTLAADTSKGKRPGFSTAAAPEHAEPLYRRFVDRVHARYPKVVSGRFGADMKVALINDGPVTFLLER